jgi:hypothetical protein
MKRQARVRFGSFCGVIALAMAIATNTPASASTTYYMDFQASPDLIIEGFIQTDGKLGTLSRADIVGMDFYDIVDSYSQPMTPVFYIYDTGNALSATSTGLFFDFVNDPPTTSGYFIAENQFSSVLFCASGCNPSEIVNGDLNFPSLPDGTPYRYYNVSVNEAGLVQIGATAPLPATLPLFAAGLAAMGLVVWRRRRKVLAA